MLTSLWTTSTDKEEENKSNEQLKNPILLPVSVPLTRTMYGSLHGRRTVCVLEGEGKREEIGRGEIGRGGTPRMGEREEGGLGQRKGTMLAPLPLLQERNVPSISQQNLPAKSGIEAMVLPRVMHCIGVPPIDPLFRRENGATKEMYQQKMQRHDTNRLMYPDKLINRIVYDSFDPPPHRKTPSRFTFDTAAVKLPANAVGIPLSTPTNDPFYFSGRITSPTAASNASAIENGSSEFVDSLEELNLLNMQGPTVNNYSVIPVPTTFKIKVMSLQNSRNNAATAPELKPYYVSFGPEDQTLEFESRFECGNLRRAIRVFDYEYDLCIRPDINTRRHTQWFYFRVRNGIPGIEYKFNVINLTKLDSLYNYGMRPLMYSEIEASRSNKGWFHCGTDISYYQNSFKRKKRVCYYSLTFKVQFDHPNDTVYFAYSYPYSYSDLQYDLEAIETDPLKKIHLRRRTMCQTLAGNGCDLLTITDFSDAETLEGVERMKNRAGVIISSRVHPGETNASWIMRGIIDTLVGNTPLARKLRSKFIFKIIPMLNPDGVICGNYRCSLAGLDLNRQWASPSKHLMPTIWHMKEIMKRLKEDRTVALFTDIHGHSRSSNLFIYGCDDLSPDNPNRILSRVFPHMISKICPQFSFKDCNFVVQRSKQSTARVVAFNELGILYAYTMESSFAGASRGPTAGLHFTLADYAEMGKKYCEALLDFSDEEKVEFNASFSELHAFYGDKSKDDADSDQGSEFGGDEPDENDSLLYNDAVEEPEPKETKKKLSKVTTENVVKVKRVSPPPTDSTPAVSSAISTSIMAMRLRNKAKTTSRLVKPVEKSEIKAPKPIVEVKVAKSVVNFDMLGDISKLSTKDENRAMVGEKLSARRYHGYVMAKARDDSSSQIDAAVRSIAISFDPPKNAMKVEDPSAAYRSMFRARTPVQNVMSAAAHEVLKVEKKVGPMQVKSVIPRGSFVMVRSTTSPTPSTQTMESRDSRSPASSNPRVSPTISSQFAEQNPPSYFSDYGSDYTSVRVAVADVIKPVPSFVPVRADTLLAENSISLSMTSSAGKLPSSSKSASFSTSPQLTVLPTGNGRRTINPHANRQIAGLPPRR